MSGRTPRSRTREAAAQLRHENEQLRSRLEQAEATLQALTAGEVDAIIVGERERVLTLETPELPYRLAVEQMLYPAVTLTDDGRIIYANRRFAEQLGMLQSELTGKSLATFVTPASRPAFETLLRGVGSDDVNPVRAEIILKGDGGMAVPVWLGASALREGAFGPCLVVTDLTMQQHYDELRRTQAALRASEAQLREAGQRKDEFVAALAHELRNPLAAIRNAIRLLKAKGPAQRDLQWGRDVIDRQVDVMARLLEDLLDVSRISLNKLQLRTERVALATVVDAALETSRPLIEAGGHTLTVSVPEQPITLDADPVRLAQVFSNLLSNAAKYTEDGGAIRMAAEARGTELIVSVQDNGIGISPEMVPRIFDMFSQAKSAVVRSQGGLGIGLSLVKGIVELHGGSVEAKSDGAGRGSEFIVRIPLPSEAPSASA